MPGEQESTQTQSSSSKPWEFAMGPLTMLRNRFSELGRDPSYIDAMDREFSGVRAAMEGVPNFGGAAAAGVGKLFGSDYGPQIGLMNRGYGDLERNIGATARGEELDPYKTPGFGDAISRMTGDITDRVKSVYNAAGRDPSGAGSFAGSLGKGLTEGIAPVIQSQFNQNNANRFSAADSLFRGAGSTASGTAGLNELSLANILKGIGGAAAVPGLFTQNAAQKLGLTQSQLDVPWTQAQRWLQSVLPMAALGSDSSGTATKTSEESTAGNIMGGIFGGLGALKGVGGLSGLTSLLTFSDERVKENIEEVGELHDGQPIYSYNYIGDNVPRIGLMAQEVEKLRPDAVVEIGGVKAVDYGKATEGARRIGMAAKYLEAA